MEAFARGWGALLPLRWYQQILFDQAARGAPTHASAMPYAILSAMAVGLFAAAWALMRRVRLERRPESESADRGREVALRLALGSSRNRILRGLFTEAVFISTIGGLVGLLGSAALLRALDKANDETRQRIWNFFAMDPYETAVDAAIQWLPRLGFQGRMEALRLLKIGRAHV